jgi:hypothetical protein
MNDIPMEDEVVFTNPLMDHAGAKVQVVDEMGMHPEPDWNSYPAGADFGMGCPPRWYAIGEAFALRRQGDSNFSLSNGGRFDSFDYELAGRITVGRTYDCLDGWEAWTLDFWSQDQRSHRHQL